METTKLITHEQIEQFIIANYPEQAEYWLGNGRGKHTAITLTFQCLGCQCEAEITIKNKTEMRELLEMDCPNCEELDKLNTPLPFGKFRGKTINFVMKTQPSYLAWFVDNIKGEDALVELIKTHTGFPKAWAEYTAKQAVVVPKSVREEMEWQNGRFSQQTIDELFNCFYGGAYDT